MDKEEMDKVVEYNMGKRRDECQAIANEEADRYDMPKHKILLMPWWELKPAIGENLVGYGIILLCKEFVNKNWNSNKGAITDLIKHELAHSRYMYHCKGFRRVCDRMDIEEHTRWKHPDAWYPIT